MPRGSGSSRSCGPRGDLEGEEPHEMVIGRCQRSNDVIEPRLKTQWFIRTEPLAAKALAATREGRTRILPARFEKTWEHWMTSIRDWNVSRQLWWGHRIPAWYCPDGHVTVSSEPDGPQACEVCGRPASELQQDPDIFDTWFSSGLWPFSTLGWPDATPDYERFYPTSVMETGYDIIFFWVARMMMLGIHLTGEVPFHTVYLSGLIRDPEGRKMSKTKGNVVDPLAVIDETGADALRFAVIHGTTPGLDQKFGRTKLEHARNFANKLWNATRFVAGARPASIPEDAPRAEVDERRLGPTERWLRSRVAATTTAVDEAMAGYAFGEVTRILYDAIWSEFCDWGLELAKVRLADESLPAEEREATWWTLVDALDAYLRLLHPVMPFVTEALWAAIPHRASDPELLIVARWPAAGNATSGSRRGSTRSSRRSPRSATRGPPPASTPPAGWRPTCAAGGDGRDCSRRSPRRSSGWPAPVHSCCTTEAEDLPRPDGSPRDRAAGRRHPGDRADGRLRTTRRSSSARGWRRSSPRPRAGSPRPAPGSPTPRSWERPLRPWSTARAPASVSSRSRWNASASGSRADLPSGRRPCARSSIPA